MHLSRQQWLFLGLLVVVFGVWTWEYFGQKTWRAVVPVDAAHAVAYADGRTGPQLVLVDARGAVQWSTAISPIRETAVHSGMSVSPDIVTARVFEDDKVKTAGWDATNGASLWTSADVGIRHPAGLAPAYVSHVSDSYFVYEVETTTPVSVVALDRKTGTEIWKTSIPNKYFDVDPAVRAWLTPRTVVVDKPATIALIDRATGQLDTVTARRWVCLDAETLYFEPENASVLHALDVDTRTDVPLGELTGNLTGLCGHHRNTSFLLVDHDYSGRIEILDGTIRTTVDLAPWSVDPPNQREWNARYASDLPFSGELPRFVPIPAVNWHREAGGTPAEPALLVFDTEARKIAQAVSHPVFGEGHWMKRGDRFLFVHRGVASDATPPTTELVLFDGASGQVIGAAEVSGAAEVLPEHLTDGVLWLFDPQQILTVALPGFTTDSMPARIRIQHRTADWQQRLRP